MKLIPKLNLLWISLPLSVICLSANANTTTTASTTTTTVATTASTPATTAAIAAPAATSTTAAPKKEEAASVKFGVTYEAGYSLQAETQPKGTRDQSMSHSFTPKLSYGEYKASMSFTYDQNLVDSVSSEGWGDPSFGLSKKAWSLGEYFKLGPSANLKLPMTDASKNEVGLMYNIGGALDLSLNTKTLGLDSWSLGYQFAANKNFTNYDTNVSGDPLTSHKIRNRVSFGYSFTDSFSFFNMFDFNSSYSVNGVVTNSFFSLQSFGYGINDNVSISLAHSNGGAYLKKGTYENNLKFFDSKSSNYSFGLEVSL